MKTITSYNFYGIQRLSAKFIAEFFIPKYDMFGNKT